MLTWIAAVLAVIALILALAVPIFPRVSSLGGRIPLGRWGLFGGWALVFFLIAAFLSQSGSRPTPAEGISQAESAREATEAARSVETAREAAAAELAADTAGVGADTAGVGGDLAAALDDRLMAYRVAEEALRGDPRSPGAMRFPGAEEGRAGHVTRLGDRRYEIRSYLEGVDARGTPTRNRWTARVERGEGESWVVRDLVIEDILVEGPPASP